MWNRAANCFRIRKARQLCFPGECQPLMARGRVAVSLTDPASCAQWGAADRWQDETGLTACG
jgi:hypothetical protein